MLMWWCDVSSGLCTRCYIMVMDHECLHLCCPSWCLTSTVVQWNSVKPVAGLDGPSHVWNKQICDPAEEHCSMWKYRNVDTDHSEKTTERQRQYEVEWRTKGGTRLRCRGRCSSRTVWSVYMPSSSSCKHVLHLSDSLFCCDKSRTGG